MKPAVRFLLLVALSLGLPMTASATEGRLDVRMQSGDTMVVLVDGKVVGETPLETWLDAGSYRVDVKVAESSARSISTEVEIEVGATVELVGNWSAGTLGVDLGSAWVTLSVDGPRNYVVTVDGEEVTADDKLTVTQGRRVISVGADGWTAAVQEITLRKGEEKHLHFELQEAPVRVRVAGVPNDALVTMLPRGDGDPIDLLVADGLAEGYAPSGRYRLRILAPSILPYKETITLIDGKRSFDLSPDLVSTLVGVRFSGLPTDAILTVRHAGGEERLEVKNGRAGGEFPEGQFDYSVEAENRQPVVDRLELEVGEPCDLAISMRLDSSNLTKRNVGIRTGVLGGATGALGVAGAILLGQSSSLYDTAEAYHGRYMDLDVGDEIVDARESRDEAYASSQQAQIAGLVLVSAAAGTGVATMISAVSGRKQVRSVQVSAAVGREYTMIGITGRW